MTTASEFSAAITKSVTNMDRLNQFVNGGDNETVDTDNGPIPTIAKLIADNVPSPASPVFVLTGTSHTLLAEHAGAVLIFTNDSDITLTIPNDTVLVYPVGGFTEIHQAGNGNVTPVAGSGLNPLKIRGVATRTAGLDAIAGLRKRSADTFAFTGDVA